MKKKFIPVVWKNASNLALAWLIPVGLLLIWGYLSASGNLNQLFPTPRELVQTTVRLISDGTLFDNLRISLIRAAGGLAIGGVIGFVLGVLTGQFETADTILNTPIQMIKSVPRLAVLPLILIWFGIGETAKVVLIALSTFFPVYLNTFHGIRSINPELIEMGKVYGFSSWEMFKHITFPGAISSIMIGVRQSLGSTWLILIVAETIAAKSGIGYMATNAREYMMMDVIVLSMILYALLGMVSDRIAVSITKRLLQWDPNYRRS
ncbi:ABC transporter permease [Megasphaera cerevisiae DSM 20462]|uniref:ABC transporter permease n=1 Tax=Megasphaera cerevisiae DSM 20462 TaxID=1122219 RepID=A0A0J6WWQ3_9FIRM|nr:ABC transporter permease [Megasphaera cerevisiae DSM 20462]OKY53071.1 ABC transporter permease [Megasphaera cerevisiae]